VGAAAVDAIGVLAAATSTGGVTLKLVGRVGDTPIAGAGNYASAHVAASADGHRRIRDALARDARRLREASRAARPSTRPCARRSRRWGREFDADVGIIAVDRSGHRSRSTARATCRTDSSRATARGRRARAFDRLQDPGLDARGDPHARARGAAARARGPPGFWQSVTGSQHEGESLRETAVREVREETGIDARAHDLAEWNLRNVYEIYPYGATATRRA
jgi:8-oxo-dGTP pyrophosphatase MutT (NUDIX family)